MFSAFKSMDEVIVGTYEGFLLGYSLPIGSENKKLQQTFAIQSHTSAVRCIDIAGRYLASGGTDDKVVVIDMKIRKEHNVLMQHDGTVDAVAFTNNGTHLVSGGADGTIIVHRVGNWQMEKKWKKAHGGAPIADIAIHPSDKLALSIGGDKTLRTWNLVKGRPAFTMNLNSKGVTHPTDIAWSPDGDHFSLISLQNVDIWTVSKAGLEKRIACQTRASCCTWITENRIAIGLDNGNIVLVTVSDTTAQTCHAHNQRVKSISYNNDNLYTVSSSGEIKVWIFSNDKIIEKYVGQCGCRVTCLAVHHHSLVLKKEECDEDIEKQTNEDAVSEEDDYPHKRKAKKNPVPQAFVTVTCDKDDLVESQLPKKKKKKSQTGK